MSTYARVMGFLAALLLSAPAWAEPPASAPATQPAGIAVVRSWDELAKQPAIRVAEGTQIRVGIEAETCPVGSAALLYVIWDGQGQAKFPEVGDDIETVVGPVLLRVEPIPEEGQLIRKEVKILARMAHDRRAGDSLYLVPVRIAQRGRHAVTLLAADRTVLARTTVTAAKEPGPVLFGLSLEGDKVGPDEPYQVVLNPLVGVPKFYNERFLAEPYGKFGPLPTFLPGQADPDLKLTRDGNTLTLVCEGAMGAVAPDRFLVRFLVNGEPLTTEKLPRGAARRADRLMKEAAVQQKPVTVRFALRVDSAEIGAGAQDKIEVQLLHCRYGWERAPNVRLEEHEALRKLQERLAEEEPPVRMSNAVVWQAGAKR